MDNAMAEFLAKVSHKTNRVVLTAGEVEVGGGGGGCGLGWGVHFITSEPPLFPAAIYRSHQRNRRSDE